MSEYDDIVNLIYPFKNKSHNMSINNRAAQFSPFASLVGYYDCINESDRIVENFVEIGESDKEEINKVLTFIKNNENLTKVKVVFFVPDTLKDGGKYVEKTGTVKKLKVQENTLCFENGEFVKIDNIRSIELV